MSELAAQHRTAVLGAPKRACHFCPFPIPDSERAIRAATDNAWAHFECWYDGTPFRRDPDTGELLPTERTP
jgi:hypothetical protein